LLLASRLKNVLSFYYGWVVVGASGTVVFGRMAPNITTLTIFIYPMSEELGWNRTVISGAVSAGALAALVLSPAIGWAIDRYGTRPVMVVSMVVLGVSMTSLAWATEPLTFYLAYGTARVVFHTSAPIGASTVVSRWFIKKRGRAIGIIFLFGAIGGLVFTMQAALIIDHFGTKIAWSTLGLLVLGVSVLPSLLLVAERPEDIGLLPDGIKPDEIKPDGIKPGGQPLRVANPAPPAPTLAPNYIVADDSWSLRDAMGTKAFWVLFFMGMAMFCVNTGTNVHIGAYYRDQGLTLTLAAVAISFSWFVSAFGSVVWGWVLEKIDARYAYSLVLFILGISTLYLLTVDGVSGAFVAAALIGSVSAGSQVIPTIMYADYFGRNSLGKIRGISETGVLIGQSAGPLFAGLVFDLNGSYSFVFLLFGGIAITCALIVLTATRPVLRHPLVLNHPR